MRPVIHRKPRFNKALDRAGRKLLDMAAEIWKDAAGFDTAVRDQIAEGLAYIVHAGYDSIALNLNLASEAWMAYIDNATAEWFRNRGFAEWFCLAAANGFRNSRPRILSDIKVIYHGKAGRRIRKPANAKPKSHKRTLEAK